MTHSSSTCKAKASCRTSQAPCAKEAPNIPFQLTIGTSWLASFTSTCTPTATTQTALPSVKDNPFACAYTGTRRGTQRSGHRAYTIAREGGAYRHLRAHRTKQPWPRKQADLPCEAPDDIELLRCLGNWTQAENNAEIMDSLLEQAIQQGWVKVYDGSREDAKSNWPQRTAIGKLNLVLAEHRDPRLVLDSTVCNANALCRIPEQVSLPTALDVHRTFLPADRFGQWTGIALDSKAAQQRIKVHPSEHGTLLFEWKGKLHYYAVCQFGAKFSAYWWQRLGALLTRITHSLF